MVAISSSTVAGALAGGFTLFAAGKHRWSKAQHLSDKITALGMMALGGTIVASGVWYLFSGSNAPKKLTNPNSNNDFLDLDLTKKAASCEQILCRGTAGEYRTLHSAGIDVKALPPMSQHHYTNLVGYYSKKRQTRYCYANLTKSGKEYLSRIFGKTMEGLGHETTIKSSMGSEVLKVSLHGYKNVR